MRTWQGRIRGIGLLLGLFGVLASAANCGSDGDSSQDGAGAGAGAGGGNGTGGTGAVFDLDASPGDSGDGSTIDPDAACATASEEATLVPVNMIIMFDRSGSMDQSNKWPNATSALTAFFEDPGTAGLRIALRFFPDDTPTSGFRLSERRLVLRRDQPIDDHVVPLDLCDGAGGSRGEDGDPARLRDAGSATTELKLFACTSARLAVFHRLGPIAHGRFSADAATAG